MKISVDASVLGQAVKTVQHLSGGAPLLNLKASKGLLTLVSQANGNGCLYTVPCDTEQSKGAAEAAVESQVFLAALSKRKKINLEFGESSVTVSESRYSVEIMSQTVDVQAIVPEDLKPSTTLTPKFLVQLQKLISKIELRPLLSTYSAIPIGIQQDDSGTFVASYDFYQSAFYFDPELKGKINIVLPNSILIDLVKEMGDSKYAVALTDSTVYAWNDVFQYSAVLPSVEGEQVSFSDMLSLYKDLRSVKDKVKLVMKAEPLRDLLENGRAVYDKDSTFTFEAKGDKCKLELKSSYGKMSSTIALEEPIKKDVKFGCDYSFFISFLSKAPQTLTLHVVPDRLLLFTHKPVTYMLGLN